MNESFTKLARFGAFVFEKLFFGRNLIKFQLKKNNKQIKNDAKFTKSFNNSVRL